MNDDRFDVEHRNEEFRFVLVDTAPSEGEAPVDIGLVEYLQIDGDDPVRIFAHTEVSGEYGGMGLASVLVRAAVEQSAAEGFGVVPVCPYVVKWFEKHPEFAKYEVKARPEHLQALRSRNG